MMDTTTERMTAELAAELATNERRRKLVDPRTRPVRFANLRAMAQSALHAWQSFQEEQDTSLAKRLGSGTHAILLGQPVAVFDVPAKKGKGNAPRNGEAWEKFKVEHAGAVILSRKEYERAMRIADAVRSDGDAEMLLLSPGMIHERTILWEQDGRARRSTPDARLTWVTEVKTTRCADPRRFRRDIRFHAYHAQVADQVAAVRAETGKLPSDAFIVAVETVRPFAVQVFRLTPKDLALGDRLCRSWLDAYIRAERRAGARAHDRDAWVAYSSSVVDADLPEDDFDVLPMTEESNDEASDGEAPEVARTPF